MTAKLLDFDSVKAIYNLPFPDLLFRAQTVHRQNFSPNQVQKSTLLSIKTGGCSEDCAYCPQSVHNDTELERHKLLPLEEILSKAAAAREGGSTRFCMGAAWRQVKDGPDFDNILSAVEAVAATGMEVCCTLGMLTEMQAKRLKQAGCHAYNHNLDTSPEYYGNIISTRTYEDRLQTLEHVRQAGITVCCGGIIGMGESIDDRLRLLMQLASQDPQPESVPINMLIRIEGTPMEFMEEVGGIEFVRIIATARILMPKSMVRLSAGRTEMSDETQALCFMAGANSIFSGEKLLTAANPSQDADSQLMQRLGMQFMDCEKDQMKTACQVSQKDSLQAA